LGKVEKEQSNGSECKTLNGSEVVHGHVVFW
jgi:hypothetical protein